MKKFLALALALVLALSLAACGKKADDNNGNGDEAKGSVYYLNFKPEADKAWQDLAKTYTCLLYTSRNAVCHHGVGGGDLAAGQQARQDGAQDQQHGQSQ